MLKKLGKLLLKKYDYKLEDHILVKPIKKQSKILLIGTVLFGVYLLLHLMQMFEVFDLGLNFITFILLFMVFIAFPLSLRKNYRGEFLLITPELLFQKVENNEYRIVYYDQITTFEHNEVEVMISQKDVKIILPFERYDEYIEQIIDVLEAKGKTFDSSKKFMIRPINILITDNKIHIKDVKTKETHIEKITSVLSKKYSVLTPGFINEVIPKDSTIYSSYIKSKDLYLELSHLEINGGHPANVAFGSIKVNDCLMLFENIVVVSLLQRKENDRKAPFTEIEASPKLLAELIEKGVISEWRFKKNSADIIFAVGIGAVKTSITYSEVIIGWNEQE